MPETLPQVAIPLRNPTAPIASQANAVAARLEGAWVVVEGAGMVHGTRLRVGSDSLTVAGASLPFLTVGPGRYRMGEEEIWVHWLDVDNRTAAMGEPGGRRVWIMDRTGQPGERLRAAREILEWYGYDLGRIHGG